MTHTCTTCQGPRDDPDHQDCVDCRTARRRAECYDQKKRFYVSYRVPEWRFPLETERMSLGNARAELERIQREVTRNAWIVDSAVPRHRRPDQRAGEGR